MQATGHFWAIVTPTLRDPPSNCFFSSYTIIGHIANSIFLVTGGRKEPMAEIFAGNQLETSIAVHTNHHSPSLVLYKLIILCEINLDL